MLMQHGVKILKETRVHPLKLKDITITDRFWSGYTELVPNVIIPYQWDILNDRVEGAELSHCLKNFRIAAGEEKGEHAGSICKDTDVYKWMEAVAYSLETKRNGELEETVDAVIELIGKTQQDDGYINTYFTIAEPGKRWTNLVEGHELYSAGYLIEAAVAYYNATGKDALLNIAKRFADLICKTFGRGEGQIKGYPGHQEIEVALIKLYYTTGEKRYLDTAYYFIDERGSSPNYFMEEIKRRGGEYLHPDFANYDPIYAQAHMPPKDQRTAEGHAVRATYMYTAMADLAYEYNDTDLMEACDAIWKNIVQKRMYITGSVGSSGHLERFTTDYDLPNDTNYSETCASIGLVMFGTRMAGIKRDASYMDIVERALYNTVLAGISTQGDRYFYVNPLEVWPESCMPRTSKAHVKPVRQRWFSVACCPTNVARTLASLGQYIYSQNDDTLLLNLFIENKTKTTIKNCAVSLDLQTSYLIDGKSTLTIQTDRPGTFTIGIRIPGYAKGYCIKVNGEPQPIEAQKGYIYFTRRWEGTNKIEIAITIVAEYIAAHPNVRADAGKVALVKGPLVYCFEQADNGENLASIYLDTKTSPMELMDRKLFDGTPVLKCYGKKITTDNWDGGLYRHAGISTEPVVLSAVPYCYWGNREPGEMYVWLKALI